MYLIGVTTSIEIKVRTKVPELIVNEFSPSVSSRCADDKDGLDAVSAVDGDVLPP